MPMYKSNKLNAPFINVIYKPFNFVGGLSNEETLSTRLYLGTPWIYRYLAVPSVLSFYLDGQQQQFQFRETQPKR